MGGAASLLGSLREPGVEQQAAALAERAAAHVSLDDPGGAASLLGRLREAGAEQQAAALLARDPAAHVSLDDPGGAASLLGRLREAGAEQQAAALAARRRRPGYSSLPSSRKAPRISSGSGGSPRAPRPHHGAGTTWTYRLPSAAEEQEGECGARRGVRWGPSTGQPRPRRAGGRDVRERRLIRLVRVPVR